MTKYEQQIRDGFEYSKLKIRQKKLSFAKNGIIEMLAISKKNYISLSFGKQSICVAHMVYQIKKEIPCYFLASEESWLMYDFAEVIKSFLCLCPEIILKIIQTKNFYASKTWKESRDLGDKDLQNMCNRKNWDGWFWGLSKDESRARKITLSSSYSGQTHPTIFKYSDNKYRCCPIMNWNILDLAAYINENKLPVLNIYKRYGLQMRTTARVTKKMVEAGGVNYLKMLHLGDDSYNKLINQYGELGYTT